MGEEVALLPIRLAQQSRHGYAYWAAQVDELRRRGVSDSTIEDIGRAAIDLNVGLCWAWKTLGEPM